MDSLRTLHARVAALSRFRGPDDPELLACRRELEACMQKVTTVRERISTLPPDAWGVPTGPVIPESFRGDEDAREALGRVVDLATQWTNVPAKCHVGRAVLETVRNGAQARV